MADKEAKEEKPDPRRAPHVVEHPPPPKKPVVMPDGHEVVTKEDIDARDS